MEIQEIRDLIAEDMEAVNQTILSRLSSDVVLINQIGHYIVNSGGKRLRPMIVLLAARACGYAGQQHIDLAAIIEFIHTATLLHDDVVDASEMRRNRQTANAVWGNAASVLVGDFLYSRSFEMMTALQRMVVMEILAQATNRIAEGEVLQLLNCHDPDTDQVRYLEVIQRKTATLFAAGAQLGAEIADMPRSQCQALAEYGLNLGIAFQLVDDALDYSADPEVLGKNLGDDLAEGKPTLPLIRAIDVSPPEQKALLRQAIIGDVEVDLVSITKVIESTDAIAYTLQLAREHAQRAAQALDALTKGPHVEALRGLADFAVSRDR